MAFDGPLDVLIWEFLQTQDLLAISLADVQHAILAHALPVFDDCRSVH